MHTRDLSADEVETARKADLCIKCTHRVRYGYGFKCDTDHKVTDGYWVTAECEDVTPCAE